MAEKDNILSYLGKNQNIVLTCNSRDYEERMIDLHKAVSGKFKKICLITVRKSFDDLIKEFKEQGVDYSNYCFIDCISAELIKVRDTKQCIYIPSPVALTELAISINKMRTMHRIDLIILDNISSFLIYNQELPILRFLHAMMIKIRKTDIKSIYSILQGGRKSLIADLTLFADKVVEF
jgi:hypothetical protein